MMVRIGRIMPGSRLAPALGRTGCRWVVAEAVITWNWVSAPSSQGACYGGGDFGPNVPMSTGSKGTGM